MGRHECRDTTGGVGVLYNVPCSVNNSMEMEYGIWNMEYGICYDRFMEEQPGD